MRQAHRRMFFILGRGRSGTTLLSSLLDSHPMISVAPEAMFVVMMARSYGGCASWDGKRVESFMGDLFRERRMQAWNLDRQLLHQELLRMGRSSSYAEVCASVYAQYAAVCHKPEDALLGDKNPHYCLAAPRLLALFPEARFIHMVRDPRDNVSSFRRVSFDLDTPSGLATRWRLYNSAVLSTAKHAPQRFHTIRFEDLLGDPRCALEELCAFLGLEFRPRMLKRHQLSPGIPDLPWHGKVPGPLDPARAYAWIGQMPRREACLIQRLTGGLAERFEYPDACGDAGFHPGLRQWPGSLLGRLAVLVERLVLALPYRIAITLTNWYRRMTGSLPDREKSRGDA